MRQTANSIAKLRHIQTCVKYPISSYQPFFVGDTYFENVKLVTPLECPNYCFVNTSDKLHIPKVQSFGFELFGDTSEEARDTQMCRDNMVENHCPIYSSKSVERFWIIPLRTKQMSEAKFA